jgi:hypothetical protein
MAAATNGSAAVAMAPSHVSHADLVKEITNKTATYGTKGEKKKKMDNVIAVEATIRNYLSVRGPQFLPRFEEVINAYKKGKNLTTSLMSSHFLAFSKLFKEVNDKILMPSRMFRTVLDDFLICYNQALEFLQREKAGDLKNNNVTLSSISTQEPQRRFLEGGGFAPDLTVYQTCFFCAHDSVDHPPEMKDHKVHLVEAVEEHNKQLALFDESQQTGVPYTSSKTGKTMKRRPPLVVPNFIVRCHCSQMECTSSSGRGSCTECTANGAKLDNEGVCSCDKCRCQCDKAYKVSGQIHQVNFIPYRFFLTRCFFCRTGQQLAGVGNCPDAVLRGDQRWPGQNGSVHFR